MRSTITIAAAANLLVPAALAVPADLPAGLPAAAVPAAVAQKRAPAEHPTAVTTSSGLRIALGHAPSHFLPGMVAAYATVTVSNPSDSPVRGPVTVTDAVPAGLTVTTVAGAGWTCTGPATRAGDRAGTAAPDPTTTTCTRSDGLRRRSVYPPIRIIVDVAADVPEWVRNSATVRTHMSHTPDGADTTRASATDRIPLRDACPYGWSPERTVAFAPPVWPEHPAGLDSGVVNPQRADGCTLLDAIWSAEPFANHAYFVAHVRRATGAFVRHRLLSDTERRRIVRAAAHSDVARKGKPQMDESCPKRIALTFDDGTSSFRPRLLQVLRDKQVHATFFDNGVRVQANPQIARFQVAEGHVELNHTVLHVHMDQLPPAVNRDEVLRNEAILAAAGAPLTFKGIRPPFGGSNPAVRRLLTEMGYTAFLNRINAEDWLPDKSAAAIRDDIIAQLTPGVIVGLHDGPVDTPAGAATVEAVGQIIDRARELGYCFGVVDHTGHVVADRYVPSGLPIPQVTNPVPYRLPLAFGQPEQVPEPWVRIPSPIGIAAAHSPATFVRRQVGNTLRLTVTNHSDAPTDGSTVTVIDEIPPGLLVTSAAGRGWTCTTGRTVTCTRTDVLAPHRSYPPVVLRVNVAADAPTAIVHQPTLLGHGQAWTAEANETISVRAS